MIKQHPSGLRIGGIYRWRGGEYHVIDLSSKDQVWEALGLMGHPFRGHFEDINYVRGDGSIINAMFEQVGTIDEMMRRVRTSSGSAARKASRCASQST